MQRIYLDHNATTPSLPTVVDAMLPYLRGAFANPSSAHSGGHEARAAVEQARAHVATLVGSRPESVLFASSATEAINTAFASVCNRQPFTKGRIVVTAVEHAAVLECAELAGSHGHDVVRVRVDSSGQLDLDQLQNALTDDTLLVSAMWANNETGVIFPIAEVVRLCANRGVPIHVDAVQAAGKFPISLLDLDVDYVSISGHKIYGPKGAAALIAAEPATVRPLIVGGNQESGRRAGTENVPAIVGFGEAARLARIELDRRSIRSAHLRDRLENAILGQVNGSYCNGAGQPRLANTANIGFDGIDADSVVTVLDAAGICASTGSACHADSLSPSHVLMAMTGSYRMASEAVRFSVSHLNTEDEIDRAVIAVVRAVSSLKLAAVPG
jgi:cysteine desulfurase